MEDPRCPLFKFQRFEKVAVANPKVSERFLGQQGTVIWCDRPRFDRRIKRWKEWGYSVYFPGLNCYPSFLESDLATTGEFDREESQLGTNYQISYDTVLNEGMQNLEGCYRLPGHDWQVFFFQNDDQVE